MITFDEYEEFLEGLAASGIATRRVDTLSAEAEADGLLILKHDVEANLPAALKAARIEAAHGHAATYYFQGDLVEVESAAAVLDEMVGLGHEVAYHYDVLDANDGDFDAATEEFERYRQRIEALSGQKLATVCPHGNPTKVRDGWRSNKDYFRSPEIRSRYPDLIDIVVDFPELLPTGVYVSDAGFKLRRIDGISNNDASNESAMDDGAEIGWGDIPALAKQNSGLVVSIHPHRLRNSRLQVVAQRARMDILRTGYRLAKGVPGVKQVANKFYAVSRRF